MISATALPLIAAAFEIGQSCLIMFSSRDKLKPPSEPVVFRPNYASIYGGATILMKSPSCHGISHILSDDNDRYMYT